MAKNQAQADFLRALGNWMKSQAANLPQKTGQLLDFVLPKVPQEEIDRVHRKLSEPLKNFRSQVEGLSAQYPLLASLKIDDTIWIIEQASNVLHLTASLFNHQEVSSVSKGKLGMALIYFISPLDALPEGIIGPIGYLDDVMLAVWVLDSILNGQNDREKQLIAELWRGTPADLERLRRLTRVFDVMKVVATLGKGEPRK